MTHIEQLLQRAIDEAADGNEGFCILIESKDSADKWLQLRYDAINAAYPFSEEPLAKARELDLPQFPYMEVEGWEPKAFATFSHGADRLDQLADFVIAYLEKVLGVSAAANDLNVEEQQL